MKKTKGSRPHSLLGWVSGQSNPKRPTLAFWNTFLLGSVILSETLHHSCLRKKGQKPCGEEAGKRKNMKSKDCLHQAVR
jgi:hypothetical protein